MYAARINGHRPRKLFHHNMYGRLTLLAVCAMFVQQAGELKEQLTQAHEYADNMVCIVAADRAERKLGSIAGAWYAANT